MQSFVGSLNYYSRFIEDFAIYASVLYELREVEFFEINQREAGVKSVTTKIRKIATQAKMKKKNAIWMKEPVGESYDCI